MVGQVVFKKKVFFDPIGPCCKDCGLSLEAKALEDKRSSASDVLKKCKGDKQLRGEIIAGKNISAGTAVPSFPLGEVVKGAFISLETQRFVDMVEEDVFEKDLTNGMNFADIPENKAEHRICTFFTEEGVETQGIVNAPGTVPPGIVCHRVIMRYTSYIDKKEDVINRRGVLLPQHLDSKFHSAAEESFATRGAALRAGTAPEVLRWDEWKQFMTEVSQARAKKLKDEKSRAGQGGESAPAAPPMNIVGFGQAAKLAAAEQREADGLDSAPEKAGKRRGRGAKGRGARRGGPSHASSAAATVDPGLGAESTARPVVSTQFGHKKKKKRMSTYVAGFGGAEPAASTTQVKKAAAEAVASADQQYWSKPKEMDKDFMKQCQLGINHNRVIQPVAPLIFLMHSESSLCISILGYRSCFWHLCHETNITHVQNLHVFLAAHLIVMLLHDIISATYLHCTIIAAAHFHVFSFSVFSFSGVSHSLMFSAFSHSAFPTEAATRVATLRTRGSHQAAAQLAPKVECAKACTLLGALDDEQHTFNDIRAAMQTCVTNNIPIEAAVCFTTARERAVGQYIAEQFGDAANTVWVGIDKDKAQAGWDYQDSKMCGALFDQQAADRETGQEYFHTIWQSIAHDHFLDHVDHAEDNMASLQGFLRAMHREVTLRPLPIEASWHREFGMEVYHVVTGLGFLTFQHPYAVSAELESILFLSMDPAKPLSDLPAYNMTVRFPEVLALINMLRASPFWQQLYTKRAQSFAALHEHKANWMTCEAGHLQLTFIISPCLLYILYYSLLPSLMHFSSLIILTHLPIAFPGRSSGSRHSA